MTYRPAFDTSSALPRWRRATLGAACLLLSLLSSMPALSAETTRPRPAETSAPAYPEAWQHFLADWAQVKQNFLAHIAGAQHITIPTNPKEFEWEIDWAAQQAYCQSIAQAIFSEAQRVEFPLPDAIAARDGTQATYNAIGRAFPRCTTPKPNTDQMLQEAISGQPRRPTRESLLNEQESWSETSLHEHPEQLKVEGQTAYHIGDDYFISYWFYLDKKTRPR